MRPYHHLSSNSKKISANIENLHSKINNNSAGLNTLVSSFDKLTKKINEKTNKESAFLTNITENHAQSSAIINGFQNEVTDINSKINKLILTSEEKTALLKNNLLISLERITKELSQKIEHNTSITTNSLKSSEVIKNAIIQMASWIDSAGILIEENNQNIKKISLEKIESCLSKTETTISKQIETIGSKFTNFEIRLESIEGKIEKLEKQPTDDEIKDTLSNILKQLAVSNEKNKTNDILLNKIDNLETQIALFDKKIEKIVDFVEEE